MALPYGDFEVGMAIEAAGAHTELQCGDIIHHGPLNVGQIRIKGIPLEGKFRNRDDLHSPPLELFDLLYFIGVTSYGFAIPQSVSGCGAGFGFRGGTRGAFCNRF